MRIIILSKRASKKLDELLDYLDREWSIKVKMNFINKFDKSLERISQFPESSEKSFLLKGLHRCVITKQTTIYYKFDSKRIQIIAIFDTRMNPDRLKRATK